MQLSSKSLSLVLPFYNEGDGVKVVVEELLLDLRKDDLSFRLILVNNGSSDNTGSTLEALAQENPEIKIKHVEINQGYGWGIINGLREADGDLIGFLCGDGQTDPLDILKVARIALNDDWDIVKATRIQREDGLVRRINSLFYNRLFKIFFNVRTRDVNGNPKIFSKKTLNELNLVSKDWFIDAELMIKATRKGYKIYEVPVHYRRRVAGHSNVSLKAVLEFLGNMWRYRFGECSGN